jgi:hypothetical protein
VTACRLDNWGLFPDRNRDFCIYHLIQNGCWFQQFPMPWAPRTSFLQQKILSLKISIYRNVILLLNWLTAKKLSAKDFSY